jgi:hypothetical protein
MGFVHALCDALGAWAIYKPDGTVLSIGADLQPGIDYAQLHRIPFVADGDTNHPITQKIKFGPAAFQSYTLRNVSLAYPGADQALTLDTLAGCHLEWRSGSINVCGSAAVPILVSPNGLPVGVDSSYPVFQLSDISLPWVYVTAGSPYAMMVFDPSVGAIVNNKFRMNGFTGNNRAMNGIAMGNPPDPLRGLGQNDIDFGLLSGANSTGILEGNGPIDASRQPLGTNVWRGAITSDAAMLAAYQTFGVMSQAYFSSISVNGGRFPTGCSSTALPRVTTW